MLFAPGAGEIPGDLFGRLSTATVPVQGQTGRITVAADDGAHHRHAGQPREVADGEMHLHVHVIQRLLHPLDTPRALGHEIGQLALEGSQPGDGLVRAERAAQKPAAMEQFEPLTVAEVGLPPRDVVQLAGPVSRSSGCPCSWEWSYPHLVRPWPRPEVAGVVDSDLGECARGATRVHLVNERWPTRTQTSPGASALQCVKGA
jgi:hypothetical protein